MRGEERETSGTPEFRVALAKKRWSFVADAGLIHSGLALGAELPGGKGEEMVENWRPLDLAVCATLCLLVLYCTYLDCTLLVLTSSVSLGSLPIDGVPWP